MLQLLYVIYSRCFCIVHSSPSIAICFVDCLGADSSARSTHLFYHLSPPPLASPAHVSHLLHGTSAVCPVRLMKGMKKARAKATATAVLMRAYCCWPLCTVAITD